MLDASPLPTPVPLRPPVHARPVPSVGDYAAPALRDDAQAWISALRGRAGMREQALVALESQSAAD